MFRIKEGLKKVSGLVGICLLLGVISLQAAPTVINTADAGAGSLRQAILDAITASAATTIDFNIPLADPGYNAVENGYTITLLTALPDLPLAPLTINNSTGRGLTIVGGSSFRVFTTVNGAVVVLNYLTISNGNSNGVGNLAKGGGIFMGDSTTLTLNKCVVRGNTATNGGGGIWINNSGTLHIFDSTIRDNTATGGDGGGIRIFDSGTVNITRSTISGNHAAASAPNGRGGGIYNGVSGTVTAINATVDGNTAGNLGGGINNSESPSTVNISSSTITGNTAANGGGGLLNAATSTATLNNVLIALNTGSGSPDLMGAFTASYILVGNADGGTPAGAGNQLGTTANPIDPRIGPLKDNGGSTFTRALHNNSPALDKGNSLGLITDQRGLTRPYDNLRIPNAGGGDGADIGSFERTFANTLFDFDADGKADISVFRPSTGTWYIEQSQFGSTQTKWGLSTDEIVPADYDGDGKTDIAIYRPSTGTWYVFNSSTGTASYNAFGLAEDIPTPADYDGDGKADISVFRPSTGTWYRLNSSNGSFFVQNFGLTGDKPTLGDFDGDGKADIAVFRPSNGFWYRISSSNGAFSGESFGLSTDMATPADYDGDGKTDVAVYRPSDGMWYVRNSSNSTYSSYSFGLVGDIPAPADYDGDGRADICVFRPSDNYWWIDRTTAGVTAFRFGSSGDMPVPNAFVP